MPATKIKNNRLVALFLLGMAVFNYPILSLFNLDMMIWGIPLLYLYLFGIWAVLIFLIALAAASRSFLPPDYKIPRRGFSKPVRAKDE